MKRNIYLDIDGVIIGTASPAEDVEALLTFILDSYPQSVWWLTTHCRGQCRRTGEWLNGKVPDALAARLDHEVRPTDWKTLKTEAIDFSMPFLWLDDALLYSERRVLREHGKLDSWLVMDKRDPGMARAALEIIRRAAAGQETASVRLCQHQPFDDLPTENRRQTGNADCLRSRFGTLCNEAQSLPNRTERKKRRTGI